MKHIVLMAVSVLSLVFATAQQKEGKVIYERTSQMQIRIAEGNDGMERMLPQTRTDKFELHFANEKSLWKQAEQSDEENTMGSEDGGMQIHMISIRSNDVLFTDLVNGTVVEKRELMDKSFLIKDSTRALKWKMTGENKTILGHNCMKATSTQISTRTMMTMENDKMERKEITDTSNVIAWIAMDIPVAAGPAEYQGQLPGLILEIDVNNGRQTYKAVELTAKPDLAIIVEPTGKKAYTRAEFKKESDKLLKEMQQNMGGGGGRVIRISN